MILHRIALKSLSYQIFILTVFTFDVNGYWNFTNSNVQCLNDMKNDHSDKQASQTIHSYALMPYSTDGLLSRFYETRKTYVIPCVSHGITIKQDWQKNGVAGVVWEAAYVLSDYIATNLEVKHKRVLELGAGTGLVGIASAAMGATVTVTDVAKALPLLQENVDFNFPDINQGNVPVVKELEWGKGLQEFQSCFYDFIFGADIIYMEGSFNALIKTLSHLSKCSREGKTTKIYLSAKLRYDRVEVFLSKLKKQFSAVNKVYEENTTNVVVYECF